MTDTPKRSPRLPPRWVVVSAWVIHRAIYRLSRGRKGLWTPKPNRWGTMRLTTVRVKTGRLLITLLALDAIAPTRATHPALRQRVEHLQLLRQDDIARFGALGVIASMQPIHATSDRDLVDRYWGVERAARAYPWRQLLSAGASLAFGSDAPVEPIDPR